MAAQELANVPPGASRRGFLAGACGVGVIAALGGCATYGESTAEPAAPATPADTAAASESPPNGSASGAPEAPATPPLATVADIPVGGGTIFAAEKVVVTQPEAGTIKAFSTTCTHQGCTVSAVAGGTINCPCHGSKFRIADGAVAGGPAKKPLPPVAVDVTGDAITLA
jgi:Rieske Fe-S protein